MFGGKSQRIRTHTSVHTHIETEMKTRICVVITQLLRSTWRMRNAFQNAISMCL